MSIGLLGHSTRLAYCLSVYEDCHHSDGGDHSFGDLFGLLGVQPGRSLGVGVFPVRGAYRISPPCFFS